MITAKMISVQAYVKVEPASWGLSQSLPNISRSLLIDNAVNDRAESSES